MIFLIKRGAIMDYINYIIIFLLIAIIMFLLSRLSNTSPFRRSFHKKPWQTKIDVRGDVTLTFHLPSKREDSSTAVKDAVFDVMYQNPELNRLTVISEKAIPFDFKCFVTFRFLCKLDLRKCNIINNHNFDIFGFFEMLVLPESIHCIHFAEDCRELKDLYIPSSHLVPAFQLYGKPIRVDPAFCLLVRPSLVRAYQDSPEWAKLQFFSESGKQIKLKVEAAHSFSECF